MITTAFIVIAIFCVAGIVYSEELEHTCLTCGATAFLIAEDSPAAVKALRQVELLSTRVMFKYQNAAVEKSESILAVDGCETKQNG